jgi:hypothetical protein
MKIINYIILKILSYKIFKQLYIKIGLTLQTENTLAKYVLILTYQPTHPKKFFALILK